MNQAANKSLQRKSFNDLVENGTYDKDFEHARPLQEFVTGIILEYFLSENNNQTPEIIDCGCGTGAWLAHIEKIIVNAGLQPRLFGYDLSDGMVALAKDKLGERAVTNGIKRGDLLNPESYIQTDGTQQYDLIFTYDSIQQIPRNKQYTAVELMIEQLKPGGVLAIFDHDKDSIYGRMMGRKKFLTQYLFLPLLPRYYCNAKYPSLSKIATRLKQSYSLTTNMLYGPGDKKIALVIRLFRGSGAHR